MKTWTVRLPDELDKQLSEYAKREDMSKNQVIKKAIRLLMQGLEKEREKMPAVRKKVHPLIAKMQYEADIRGVSNEELAAAMRMSERTLCRRKSHPNELSVDELTKLAKKLKMEIVITADGLECK